MSFFTVLLLIPALIRGILDAPPRDLASLIDAEATLKTLAIDTDEDSLMKLLAVKAKEVGPTKAELQAAVKDLRAESFKIRRKGRKLLESAGAAAIPFLEKALEDNDPEVRVTAKQLLAKVRSAAAASAKKDTDYVNKLLAIRVLEARKKAKALPLLKQVATGKDITLAHAATDAIAVIEGKKLERKNAPKQLTALLTALPDDVGFLAAADVERGRKGRPAAVMLDEMKKMKDMVIPKKMVLRLQQMVGMSTTGVLALLSETGNISVDSIVFITSNRIGAERRAGYAGFVFKGFYDPARVTAAIKRHGSQLLEFKYKDHTVLYEKYGPAMCALDKTTFLLSMGPQRDGTHMMPLISALTKKLSPDQLAAKKKTLKIPSIAMQKVIKGDRIAAAGSLSAGQKALISAELANELARMKQRLQANPNPRRQIELTTLELILALNKVDYFTGTMDKKHAITLKGICKEEKAAVVVTEKLKAFDAGLRALIKQDRLGQEMDEMIKALTPEKPLAEIKADGKNAFAVMEIGKIALMPMLMMMAF